MTRAKQTPRRNVKTALEIRKRSKENQKKQEKLQSLARHRGMSANRYREELHNKKKIHRQVILQAIKDFKEGKFKLRSLPHSDVPLPNK